MQAAFQQMISNHQSCLADVHWNPQKAAHPCKAGEVADVRIWAEDEDATPGLDMQALGQAILAIQVVCNTRAACGRAF